VSKDERALEPMIKDFVLANESFFGDLGESITASEKNMGKSRKRGVKATIADLLVFTEKKGIIGVEVKTEYDNLQRLNRQMKGYSLVCDFVWVVCHDKHVEDVEKRLKRYHHQHVGIIAYTEFNDTILGGIYKHPFQNQNKSTYHALNILWKDDLVRIMGGLRYPSRIASRELGFKNTKETERHSAMTSTTFSNKMKKGELINNIITRFGPIEANRMVCKFFINNENPNKVLTLKHFKPQNFHKGD